MRNWLIASIAVFALVAWAGCQAPCDAMCDAKADYLEACIDATATALNEGLTPPEGWDLYDDPQQWWTDGYGVSGAEEYAETCKADADAVLAGDVDRPCGSRSVTTRPVCTSCPSTPKVSPAT